MRIRTVIQTVCAVLLSFGLMVLGPATSAAAQPAESLVGSAWQLVSYGPTASPTEVVQDSAVTLEFRDERNVVGSGGCNTYRAGYTVTDGQIRFDAAIRTEMACLAPGIMEQEEAFLQALSTASRYTLDGNTLTIEYGEGNQLVFKRIGPLVGSQWQLVSSGAAAEQTPAIEGSRVTLQFNAEGQAGGTGGCNSYGAKYVVNGSEMTFSEIISTMMACTEGGILEQELAFFEALRAATRFTMTADRLVIEYGEGQQLIFRRIAALAGTDWQLLAFEDGTTTTNAIAGTPLTLQFGADNRVTGSSGCNNFSGPYTQEGETIRFGALASTKRACTEDALNAQERAYLDALTSASAFILTENQLILVYGEGRRLVFTRGSVA